MLACAELLPFANAYTCKTEHAWPIYTRFWCDNMHSDDWVMTLFPVMDVRQVTNICKFLLIPHSHDQWLPERSISSKI